MIKLNLRGKLMAFLILKSRMYTPVTYMGNMVFANKKKTKKSVL